MADERKPAGLRFREPLLARIDELAAADGRSRNNWMERFLESALMGTQTPEAVSSPGSGASAQSRVVAPSSGAAPPVAPAEPPPADLRCPGNERHVLTRHSRMAGHPWACPLCNRKAVPR